MAESEPDTPPSSHSRGVRVLPNGDVYEGEFEGNLPHGQGLLTYYNGSIYSGAFQSGKKHGFGTYRWSDGNVYKGNWEKGSMHGAGTMTYSEGGSYSGMFVSGKKHGDGVFTDKRGNRFCCPWDQGVMTGHGTIVFHTGTCYEGDIAAGQAHGSGSCEYSPSRNDDGGWAGCIYTGLWCRGVQNGLGTVKCDRHASAPAVSRRDSLNRYTADFPFDSWEGQWCEGERQGKGQLSLRDGSVVSGLWEGNAWAGGSARIVYGNGSGVYEGSVVAETWQRQGRGVWRGSNGEVYEGDWVSDQRCGHGQWTHQLRTYTGDFCDNLPSGQGVLTYGSQLRFTGTFSHGLRHGRGVFELPHGLRVIAVWVMDKAQQLIAVDQPRRTLTSSDAAAAAWEFNSCRGSSLPALMVEGNSKLMGLDETIGVFDCLYDGSLTDRMMHELGVLVMPLGSIYFGNFSSNKRQGHGHYMAANGDCYNGEWQDDEWHGSGVLKLTNGHEIRGTWLQSCPHESVCIQFASGGKYTGAYVRGVRRGQGIHEFPNGCKYEGLWSSGVFHGSGQLSQPVFSLSHVLDCLPVPPANHAPPPTCSESALPCIHLAFDIHELPPSFPLAHLYLASAAPSTSSSPLSTPPHTMSALFSGFFIEGRRDGKGRQVFSDGCAYDGEWKADTFSGNGILSLASGSVYNGVWRGGKMCGHGSFTCVGDGNDGGSLWEGQWCEGERQGKGQLSLRDGSVVSGLWEGNAWAGGSARIVYGNGSGVYEGSVVAETWQRQGRGVWRGSNGEVYEGDWVSDQRCGHGQWNSGANGAIWDCLWTNNAVDCSQPVHIQFIDGSCYKGSAHYPAAIPAAAEDNSPKSSISFNPPAPVAAPLFHGAGSLISFDGFTCVPHSTGTPVVLISNSWQMHHALAAFHGKLIIFETDGLFCRYTGEFANGVRQGQGVWSTADGSVRYEGQWLAGLKHGRGTFVSAGQASYTGEFKSGLMEGAGRLLHDDGQEYGGAFRAGLKHGSGKLVMVNGDTYEGAFVKDLMHGRGVLTLADGTQLRGCFNEGFLEGQGEQVSETDVAYVGEWKGGKFHGAGLLRTREGDTFDGKFSSGLPMGQGSWRLADGTSIVGQWNGGSLQASGCIIYPDGSRYDGSMKASDRMSNVAPHGRGVRTYLDGTVYDGEWVMGVRCGKAMVTHANGSVFDGSYDNDVACGQGSFAYPGGQIEVKGTWLQGQLHGEVTVMSSGREEKQQWAMGKKVVDKEV